MIIRSSFHTSLFSVGLLTSVIASLSACFETDLKKTIALSTLRQLGIITSTLAMGIPILAFFHLLTHAIFKALLFISAGKIIHESSHTQDIRFTNPIIVNLPYTTFIINSANIALSGIPFLAGFYSKHLLLESFIINHSSPILSILFFIAIGLSSSYSMRLSFSTLVNSRNMSPLSKISEDSTSSISMFILFLASVFSGALLY